MNIQKDEPKSENYIPVGINAEGRTKNILKGNIDDKACIQWFGWTYKNSFHYKEKKEEMKNEPSYGKTNNLLMRKQRCRSASR